MNPKRLLKLRSRTAVVTLAAWLTLACASTPSNLPAAVTAGAEPTSAPKPASTRQAASPSSEAGSPGDRILEPYPYASAVPPPTPTLLEAAICGHWPEPPECTASGVATAE